MGEKDVNISETVERLLRDVEKPARYCGGERNAVQKDPRGVQARFLHGLSRYL